MTRFATQGFAPGPGVKAAEDVGAPHCPTERGPMAAQVLALRFQAQLWAGILPTLPCSPCHGAGPGWLSEPAGSEHSERGSCPAAASSSCTLGHSSDTALTQPRHSTNTVRYNLDPALTWLRHSWTHLGHCWTHLGHSWTQLGHSSDTVGHSQTLLDTPRTQPTTTPPGSPGESMGSQTCPASPTAPERGAGLEGHGQAWVRQLTGAASGASAGQHHGQHQGRSVQPHTHPWPNQGPKDSTWPKHHCLAWPMPGRLLCTDKETAHK